MIWKSYIVVEMMGKWRDYSCTHEFATAPPLILVRTPTNRLKNAARAIAEQKKYTVVRE
jgi:hypothetical protein